MSKNNEKSLLFQDFNKITEKEEHPITIEYDSPLTASINFLNGVSYDTSISELSGSLTSNNIVKTNSNSATLVSYTGAYNHAASYLYQDNYLYNEKIINSSKNETNYIREITLPVSEFGDSIKKNSIKISLQKGIHEYSRFLRIKNDNSYNYGQNCAFVYFNDEKWNIENELTNKFSFVLNFRLNNDWLEKITTTSVSQYLLYKPRLTDRGTDYFPDQMSDAAANWTYCVSGIDCNATYEEIYNNKYIFTKDTLGDSGSQNSSAYSLRLTYYKSGSPHPLSGRFVFETCVRGVLIGTFPAISSSAVSNFQVGTLTAHKNLVDSNWHQLLWSFDKQDSSWYNTLFLDKVRLIPNVAFPATGSSNLVSIANYTINNESIFAPTPLFLGTKIEPIDNQVTRVNFKIYEATKNNVDEYYKAKIIPAVYNINIIPLTAIDIHWYAPGKQQPSVTGSSTNIFSFFGATDSKKFINQYVSDTSDEIPNNNFNNSLIDKKKLLTSKIISEFGTKGFDGDIASLYIFKQNIDLLYDGAEPIEYPLPGIIADSSYFTSKQYNQKEPYVGDGTALSASNLIGDYRFYEEDYKSSIVKNRIKTNDINYKNIENEDYNYYGAGIFINHNNFRKNFNFNIPNCSIKQEYDFYDTQETSLSSKLNHGKIFHKNNYECGLVFYDLGLIIFDNNILINNSTSSLLSSITTNTNFLFKTSTTSSNNFYFDEINYEVERVNYSNYVNVILEENEFNNSENTSKIDKQDFTYPSTISFYNANDECLYVSKIKNVIEKNKFFKLIHKVKLSF